MDTWAELVRRDAEIDVELLQLAKGIKDAAGGLMAQRKDLKDEQKAIRSQLRKEANKQLPLNFTQPEEQC